MKRIYAIVCALALTTGCSSSKDSLEKALADAQKDAFGNVVPGPLLTSSHTSSCILTVFENAYRKIELNFNKNALIYKTVEYLDSTCTRESRTEELVGTITSEYKLSNGGFTYEFKIPLEGNSNISALKTFNLKKNTNEILISDFYFNYDEREAVENSPSIKLISGTIEGGRFI